MKAHTSKTTYEMNKGSFSVLKEKFGYKNPMQAPVLSKLVISTGTGSIKDKKKIEELLTRGVQNIYPSKEWLKKALQAGEKLKVYIGIDPTAATLHIGNAITLIKLKAFQELGHKVIFLIGSFTGMIGDPTGKAETRKPLSRKQVLENAKKYKAQAGKFLKFAGENAAEVVFNHQWLDKLTLKDLAEIGVNITARRLLERDMFQKRDKKGEPIYFTELMYPLLQGYDSVAMAVDGEIGGNDQTFNMLVGRDLLKKISGKEKFVLTMKLLIDPTGKKMGKTEGNFISLGDNPGEMFGKIMSWPDSLLAVGFELLTDTSLSQVEEILKNPREAKARLAGGVVGLCHGPAAALAARKEFDKVFKGKELPSHIAGFSLKEKAINLVDLLVKTKLAPSRSEARRLVAQGGVKIGGKVQPDWRRVVCINKGEVIRVGKRKFLKII